MKFGKQILSQQVSGWGGYYLDYKSLKKIINSLEKGRLGDAALFASGIRPEFAPPAPPNGGGVGGGGPPSSNVAAAQPTTHRARVVGGEGGEAPRHADAAAAPSAAAATEAAAAAAAAAAMTATASARVGSNAQILPAEDAGSELQIHKAAFFFKLERELEKINAFYLQKEAELKERLRTLIEKRKLVLAKRGSAKLTKDSPSFYALYEGFRYFEKDLAKLQQFIEINATGFRKILKKWDKRSKSQTKELYLARQVEVQPCFNREFISEMSDVAAANLLQLENLAEGGMQRLGSSGGSRMDLDGLSAEKRLDFAATRSQEVDVLSDLEENLTTAIKGGDVSGATHMVRVAAQSEDKTSVARIVWRALVDASSEAVDAAMRAGLADFGFVDDINSRTSLHEAALAGKLQLVEACVENGVDVACRDIYGRAALSYAAMNGHADVCTFLLGLPAVDAAAADLDGFSPLVLAVMNGHTQVVRILLSNGVSGDPQGSTDLIPICLAAQGGHADITALLLQRGAKIQANPEGLTPQALAARAGHERCLKLLLDAGADANAVEKGTLWTPLFFAAESGHAGCVRALLASGARADARDEKDRDAAFYAAWKGHIESLNLLLHALKSARPVTNEVDAEPPRRVAPGNVPAAAAAAAVAAAAKPKKPATGGAEGDDLPPLDLDGEVDGIPSLSLPPPIIPFRTYGHNYLDKRSLVTVSLSNSSVKLYKIQDPNLPEPAGQSSSLKLVMTSRPDDSATVIPHTIILPLADEREVFSFQVASLERFFIEWELMPTFGTKVIGKAVALPSSFEGMTDRKRFVLPLQDMYLKVVGEVSFAIDFVKPFDGVQLEIGGRVETYWKSTLPASSLVPPPPPTAATTTPGASNSTRLTPNSSHAQPASSTVGNGATSAGTTAGAAGKAQPAGASATTPTLVNPSSSGAGGGAAAAAANVLEASAFVTASSLSGQHLRVAVQVTKDGVAVVYPDFTLPVAGLDVYVGHVTAQQFLALARQTGRSFEARSADAAAALSLLDWKAALTARMTTLAELLEVLPVSVGIDLDLVYPSSADVRGNPSLPKVEVNHFVDAILHTVYHAGTLGGRQQQQQQSQSQQQPQGRKIFFSSRSPTVCTALNWKQPNYAVLFASYCGLARTVEGQAVLAPCDRGEPDPRRQSISEAVRFAKNNNLLGIMVDSIILNQVPQLIQSVKAAGLLLITIGHLDASAVGSLSASTLVAAARGTDSADAGGGAGGGVAAATTTTAGGAVAPDRHADGVLWDGIVSS